MVWSETNFDTNVIFISFKAYYRPKPGMGSNWINGKPNNKYDPNVQVLNIKIINLFLGNFYF